MKKHILILLLLLLANIDVYAQKMSDDNFIYTAIPRKATQGANLNTLVKTDLVQNVSYFDGLGRPIQTIAIGQGAGTGTSSVDIVTPVEYDANGRQEKEYLPYTATNTGTDYLKTGAAAAAVSYYSTKFPAEIISPSYNAFSQKQFDSSPLNRIVKQAAPGNDWSLGSGHEIKMDYQTNIASEVKLFTAATTWSASLGLYDIALGNATGTTFYSAGQLTKTITYDENTAAAPIETAGSTVEFKNKEGQVVLKRTYDATVIHDTYYVYDPYGNLTYVIPPKADSAITQTILDNLCYQYKYDDRNRLVEKKLPGKQWEFIVYDKLDRPVATGPAASPFSDLTTIGWIISKYDTFDRLVYTGWMTSTVVTTAGRKTLQDAQNAATLTVINESKQANGTIDGIAAYYTNTVAPASFKLLTVNYYDNYTFPSTPSITIPTSVEGQTILTATQIKGLNAASWTRVLTTSTAVLGETSATFYDDQARPVRTYTINHLGGYTYTDNKLDFSGKPEYRISRHKRTAADAELVTKDVFTYSDQDRLLTQTHQINGGTIELIASNTYDELGQLTSKKVGNTVATPTQNVNYNYNIRGWLTAINDVTALTKAGDPKDLFAFKINYNTTTTTGVNALYNGNISETYWTSANSETILRGYGYAYDNLNRLKTGIFKQNGSINNFYDETLTYDKNGNIMSVFRNGNATSVQQIDNLVYSYGPANSINQLTKVVDNATTYKAGGFVDSAANTVDDYSYDANGNMIKDNNKNITAIVYNHLNLPTKITFATTGNIVYIYNAAGQKVQKIVNETSKAAITTDYLGGYQYDNALLKFFPTAEGYVEPSGSSYKYVYQYKDHLGNVRLSYDKTLAIKEESNFYPFGLKQEGYNNVKSGVENKYKYNGKELQDELNLNMYAMDMRLYDPAIGRWTVIDPVSHFDESPYEAFSNNPAFWEDPSGASPIYNNTTGQYVINGKVATFDEALTYANSGGNSSGDNDNTPSQGGYSEELDSNFSQDGYNIYLFRSTMGDGMKFIGSLMDMLQENETNYESTLADGERLTKIILFKKEISIDYKDGGGNKISKSKYDKLVNQRKVTTLTKTTVIKRYQAQIPSIAKQGIIDVKNIKLSLTTTRTVDNNGKIATNKSNGSTSLNTLSSNLQLIFQQAADYNNNQNEVQSGSFIDNIRETTKSTLR